MPLVQLVADLLQSFQFVVFLLWISCTTRSSATTETKHDVVLTNPETAIKGHSRSSVVVPIDAAYIIIYYKIIHDLLIINYYKIVHNLSYMI